MFFLQPILDFLHFLRTAVIFIWGISLHLGRGIFLLLQKLLAISRDIYVCVVILGEELLRFFTELNTSIDAATTYITTSANSGINGTIDAIVIFCQSFSHFFSTSDFHTRLLATRFGLAIKNLCNLLYGALKLIADTLWWLVTLVPRTIVKLVIALIDLCIFSINAVGRVLLFTIQTLLNDIFRITISLFVIFLIYKRRRHITFLTRQCYFRMKTLLQRRLQSILSRWRAPNRLRLENLGEPTRRSPLARTTLNESKISYQQNCVVCRDNPKSVLLWPCRHMCLCEFCADRITEMSQQSTVCPLCRSQVDAALSVYT